MGQEVTRRLFLAGGVSVIFAGATGDQAAARRKSRRSPSARDIPIPERRPEIDTDILASEEGQAAAPPAGGAERSLRLYNTHTKETLDIVYKRGDVYDDDAILKIATVLRDHRQKGKASITDMNRELLDLLADIADEIARRYPEMTDITFHVISGYRAPETNKLLRRQKGRGGQAENSAHTRGDAIDIRVPGVDRKELRDIAWCLQRGGVGDYPGNDFVHVDVWKKITRNANTRNFPNGERYRAWGWSPDPGQCAVPQPSPG